MHNFLVLSVYPANSDGEVQVFYLEYIECWMFSLIAPNRFKNIFIYLFGVATGLSCGMRDRQGAAFEPLVADRDLVPDQGSNLGPLHWELGILAPDHQGSSCY